MHKAMYRMLRCVMLRHAVQCLDVRQSLLRPGTTPPPHALACLYSRDNLDNVIADGA